MPPGRRTFSRRLRERLAVWRRLFLLNWNLFKASRIGVVGLAIMIAFVIIALAAPFMGLRDPIRWTAPDEDLIKPNEYWIKTSTDPGTEFTENPPPVTQPIAFRVLPKAFDPPADRIYVAAANRLYAIKTWGATVPEQKALNVWGAFQYFNVSAFDNNASRTISVPPLAMNYGAYVSNPADYEVYIGTSDGRLFIMRDLGNYVPSGADLVMLNLTGGITGLAAFSGDLDAPVNIQGSPNHVYYDGSNWTHETVPSDADHGEFASLALNASGGVAIAYYDYTTGRPAVSLRDLSGRWVSARQIEQFDGVRNVGHFTSLALGTSDYQALAYYDQASGSLKFASWNGTAWNRTVVDVGYVGQFASLRLNASNTGRLAYYNASGQSLKYAEQVGPSWSNVTVDTGGVGQYASLALNGTDDPAIAYYDATSQTLKYAVRTGAGWTNASVDTVGNWSERSSLDPFGRYASLALNRSGNASIAYYNATNRTLMYAVRSGTGWTNETVDAQPGGDLGRYVSLAFDSQDRPAIAYYDARNFTLKYAVKSGSQWVIENPDPERNTGQYASLAFDSAGRPHIGYYSFVTGRTDRDVVAVGTASGKLYLIDVGIPATVTRGGANPGFPREKHVAQWEYRERWKQNFSSEVHLATFPLQPSAPAPQYSPAFGGNGTLLVLGTEDGDLRSVYTSNGTSYWTSFGIPTVVKVGAPWNTAPIIIPTAEGPPCVRDQEIVYAASSFDGTWSYLHALELSTVKCVINQVNVTVQAGAPLPEWSGEFQGFNGAAPVSTTAARTATDGGDLTQPTVEGTTVYVGSSKGTLYALRRDAVGTTGSGGLGAASLKWTYGDPSLTGLNPRFVGPPLVKSKLSIVLTVENHDGGTPGDARDDRGVLYALRQGDGSLSWKRTFGAPISGAPSSWTVLDPSIDPAVWVGFGGPTFMGVASFKSAGQYLAPSAPSWVQRYPSGNQYWLGLDSQGRDIFSQLIWGSRIALLVGFLAAFFTVILGLVVGLVAGYVGGKTEAVLMRFTDVILVLPGLPLIITMAAVLGSSIWNIILVISLLGWPGIARIIRAEVLSLKERPFIDSARVTGASTTRIVFKHIAPNVMPLAFLYMTFSVSGAILTEAALSFIGLGDQSTMSWGQMLYFVSNSKALDSWWWLLPPGLAITLISLGFFLVGRAFDEIVNPRLRKR